MQGYRQTESVTSEGKTTVKAGAFVWMSYEECAAQRDAIGSAIVTNNFAPPNATDGVRDALVVLTIMM